MVWERERERERERESLNDLIVGLELQLQYFMVVVNVNDDDGFYISRSVGMHVHPYHCTKHATYLSGVLEIIISMAT